MANHHLRILVFSILTQGLIAQAVPKNVLILFSDDQRYNTIHALGNNEIQTPNLDFLVQHGVSMTRAHTMGGMHGALCAPSRAMLHTAKYLHELKKSGDSIPPEHIMLPQYLQTLGYKTYGIGKWHNDKVAFNRAFQNGAAIYFGGMHFPKDGGQEHPQYRNYDPSGKYDTPNQKADKFSSEFYADAAIDFLKSKKDSQEPFLCYVAFTSPHDPRTPPLKYREMYNWRNISLPANYLPQHPFDNGELSVRDEVLLPRPMSEEMVKRELALYYGMISELDDQIGRIIKSLQENGQFENTLIVFAGDNGLAVGSHGLLGKQNLYDHSMRVPLIFSHPALPQGLRLDQLCYLSDVFPTVLDILHREKPNLSSESLFNYFQHPHKNGRKNVYFAYRDIQRAVRTEDNWKYIRYQVGGIATHQLFNLKVDPYETQNLVLSEKRKLKAMQKKLIREANKYHDFLDLRIDDWGTGNRQ